MREKKSRPVRTCAECIHEYACQAWTHGTIHNMDATTCSIYETVRDSTAYFIGFTEGKKAASGEQCSFGEGVKILPDGVHELSPHIFEQKQLLHNVTVEVLECKNCGEVSIGWYRQEDTYEENQEE